MILSRHFIHACKCLPYRLQLQSKSTGEDAGCVPMSCSSRVQPLSYNSTGEVMHISAHTGACNGQQSAFRLGSGNGRPA